MKYKLLRYDDEQAWQQAGEATYQAAIEEAINLTHELHEKGQYIRSAPLHPGVTATSVRIRKGKQIVTDGPFAETREVLGGFHLIDVSDINEAIEIADRHPGARLGTVEIRPLVELAGLSLIE